MGNSLRLCIACLLPCGTLDVVRVVHSNGQVDEYSRTITTGEILEANPGHVISGPFSMGDASHRILIVSAEVELKRGHIYFLIPTANLPEKLRKTCLDKMAEVRTPQVKMAGQPRRPSRRVVVWRPHLESILEDL